MKILTTAFLSFIFFMSVLAQTNTLTPIWTKINTNIPASTFVPRELFKVDDTTLYLGSRFYLSKISKEEVDIQFKAPKTTHVIRGVVNCNNTTYMSVADSSLFYKTENGTWENMLIDQPTKIYYGWEMTTYKSELISTAWPRWISVYNFENKSWTSSRMLDTRGAGYISDFTTSNTDLFVSLYGGGVFKKSQSADDWINCNKGLVGNLNVRSVLAVNNKLIFAATENGVYYSKVSTIKWKPCKQTQNKNIKFVDLMYHNGVLYTTGVNGEFMFSKDLGKTWTQVFINNASGYVLYSVEVIGEDLYFSADGQGIMPSGVFTFPLADVLK
jgi:hypothetical protein